MRKIRTYHEVDPDAGRELLEQVQAQHRRLDERLARVRHTVAVASGKGGVGKSAITANLAAALAARGLRVGALDADLNGPSLARMLGVVGAALGDEPHGVVPPRGAGGVRVVSMELLQADEDTPLRWRGSGGASIWQSAAETGALREFLADVAWGELDVLLIDVPPGTDKMTRLLDLLPDLGRVLLVSTPSAMSRRVVARSARLLADREFGRAALVINMGDHVCPACGHRTVLFESPDDDALARGTLETWGEVPFDPRLGAATDEGRPWVLEGVESPASRALVELADRLEAEVRSRAATGGPGGEAASPDAAAHPWSPDDERGATP